MFRLATDERRVASSDSPQADVPMPPGQGRCIHRSSRHARRVGVIVAMAMCASVSACVSVTVADRHDRRLSTGTWGGDHIALTVTESGARIEFDCASGDIPKPIMIGDDGRMSVDGVYLPEHGGPVRIDEVAERKPARYSGPLNGQTLILDVMLIASNEHVGRFTLTHGATPEVRKCR